MQHISGTLTADATIKQSEGGRQFVSFSIADNETYKPKDGNERVELTTFFNCTFWLGTGIAKVLRKGATVELIGRAWAKPYKNKKNNWTAALNFNASQIRISRYAKRDEDESTDREPKDNGNTANSEDKVNDGLPF